MKLNCGPTQATKKQRAEDILREWATRIVDEGEVVFAWFPIRLGDNDCRWLEKVKRNVIGYVDAWGDENRTTDKQKLRYKLMDKRSPMWKYEAIQPK